MEYRYDVLDGADDYDLASSTSTTITIKATHTFEPFAGIPGYADITTAGISYQILDGTFNWYTHSYSKSSPVTRQKEVLIKNLTGGGWISIFYIDGAPAGTGWESTSLSGVLDHIDVTGKTSFLFQMDDPGIPYQRTWDVRAYEYSPTGTYSPYITLELLGSGTKVQTIILF